jgi:hypothetical protein
LIGVGTMIVFVHAGVTGTLTAQTIENAAMFVMGCVLGRGRQEPPDRPPDKPI